MLGGAPHASSSPSRGTEELEEPAHRIPAWFLFLGSAAPQAGCCWRLKRDPTARWHFITGYRLCRRISQLLSLQSECRVLK